MTVKRAVAAVLLLAVAVVAQRTDVFVASFDHPAIAYTATPPTDVIARLNRRIAEGEVTLAFDPETEKFTTKSLPTVASLNVPALMRVS